MFDDAFDTTATNEAIYYGSVKGLVNSIIDGGKASCFAYGQTGSGKTFTMMGNDPSNPSVASENAGLYVLAARDIFDIIKSQNLSDLNAFVSCFEIYGGKLYDLLNSRGAVKCLEDSKQQVHLSGLTEHKILEVQDLLNLMSKAHSQRSVGSTGANAESSRSHQVMQIVVKPSHDHTRVSMKRKERNARTADVNVVGKLSFIDLAGSERGADVSNNSKQTRLEGAEINTSLLALKEVIRSLVYRKAKPNGFTPFRGSKLTQVLKDSFVGDNTRTCMIACVSPSQVNCEHTLNTLRYADRVKEHARMDSRPYLPLSGIQKNSAVTPECLHVNKAISNQKNNGMRDLGHTPKFRENLDVCNSKEYDDGRAVDDVVKMKESSKSPTRPNTAPNYGHIQNEDEIKCAPLRSNLLASREKLQLARLKQKSALHGKIRCHSFDTHNDLTTVEKVNSGAGADSNFDGMIIDERNFPREEHEPPSQAKDNSMLVEETVDLLVLHKNIITDMVEIMKGEMELVQNMESIENRDGIHYAASLKDILDFKDRALNTLQKELCNIRRIDLAKK